MTFAPGSLPWLLAHDLTLSWRRFRGVFRTLSLPSILVLVATAETLFHLIALPAANWLGGLEAAANQGPYRIALAGGLLLVLCWITAQTLTGAARSLQGSSDLDILLASPLPAGHIVASRMVALSAEAGGTIALIAAPVIDMNVIAGRTHWLAAYPMLPGLSLIGGAAGMTLALALYARLGPRRGRLVSQIVATAIGGGFVLAAQIFGLLPAAWRAELTALLNLSAGPNSFETSLSWLPVRAASGAPVSLLVWLLLCALVFIAAIVAVGGRFARIVVASAGLGADPPRRRRRADRAFRPGAGRALRHKEWLLLARDPWLMSQVFLQIVYVLPIAVILLHGDGTGGSVIIAAGPSLTVICAQLAGAFAWLAISGEDAPDLIASAPITRARVERGKIEAIALPVALIVGPPLLWLATVDPRAALVTALVAAGGAASTACLNLHHPAEGKRRDLMRRHQQSRLVGLVEHLLAVLFAVACAMALIGSALAFIPIGLAVVVLWIDARRTTRPVRVARTADPLQMRRAPAE